MKGRFLVIVCLVIVLSAIVSCGSAACGPEECAKDAFEQWARDRGTPYQNEQFHAVSDDGDFATVRVVAELKAKARADWVEQQADVECQKIGGEWQCDAYFDFRLSDALVSATRDAAAAEAEATADWMSAFYVDGATPVESVLTEGQGRVGGRSVYTGCTRGGLRFTVTLHNDDDDAHCVVFGFKVLANWGSRSKEYPSFFENEYQLVAANLGAGEQREVTVIIDDENDWERIGGFVNGHLSQWHVMMVDGEAYHSYFDSGILLAHRGACQEYIAPEVIEVN